MNYKPDVSPKEQSLHASNGNREGQGGGRVVWDCFQLLRGSDTLHIPWKRYVHSQQLFSRPVI